jgi:ribosomal protein S12 methylthiotransferase accessory factor
MQVLEIDRTGGEGLELLSRTAAAAGAWVWGALERVGSLFLIASPWAPGLRCVGGLVPARAKFPALSVTGGGATLNEALVACLAEALERTAQIERVGDVVARQPMSSDTPRDIRALLEVALRANGASCEAPADWIPARALSGSGLPSMLPASWCLRRSGTCPAAVPGAAPSVGCAAAKTVEQATLAALLELVERDAAAAWWWGPRLASLIPEASEAGQAAAELLRLLRGGATARVTRILDITGELGVPVVAAVSTFPDGTGFACGLAARPEPANAARAALRELAQMEVGLQLARARHQDLGLAALGPDDRAHLARAALHINDLPLTTLPGLRPLSAVEGGLAGLTDRLRERGIDVWIVDLSRRGGGLAVIKAVAPRLQLLPADIRHPQGAEEPTTAWRHGALPLLV